MLSKMTIVEELAEGSTVPRYTILNYMARSLASDILRRFDALVNVDSMPNTRTTRYALSLHVFTPAQLEAYVQGRIAKEKIDGK